MIPTNSMFKGNSLCSLMVMMGLVVSLMVTSGCAAVLAAKQPEYVDTSVLHVGAPRPQIVATFGLPLMSEKDKDGNLVETYQFKQGYKTEVKVLRVMFHIAADVFTLFLWEILGMPLEMVFDGNQTTVNATYDENNRVQESFISAK